jgi:hypothetical protein
MIKKYMTTEHTENPEKKPVSFCVCPVVVIFKGKFLKLEMNR